jgi:hypothetical protein
VPELVGPRQARFTLGPIRGKVAQLITGRDLALNIGAAQGVTLDMVFAVLNKKASSIKDPDSGAELGALTVPKVLVKAYIVDQKVTLARTYRTVRRGLGLGPMPSLFLGGDEVETLLASEHVDAEELEEKDSIVKIGDPVVQVLDPPADT